MKQNGVPAELGRPSGASMGAMLMWLFVTSLSILFLSSLIIYFIFRARAAQWPPEGFPPLPLGLWGSTVLICISSLTLHFAVMAVKAEKPRNAALMLWVTFAIGLVFVLLQAANWFEVFRAGMKANSQYGGLFYFLTLLHALHVLGGMIGLAVTSGKASAGAYKPHNYAGLGLMGIYWHFLAVIWLVLFAVLMGTS